ncbi:hypothetical protein LTS18_012925, partial [Coniosporium uncinatum]
MFTVTSLPNNNPKRKDTSTSTGERWPYTTPLFLDRGIGKIYTWKTIDLEFKRIEQDFYLRIAASHANTPSTASISRMHG